MRQAYAAYDKIAAASYLALAAAVAIKLAPYLIKEFFKKKKKDDEFGKW